MKHVIKSDGRLYFVEQYFIFLGGSGFYVHADG